MIHPNFFIIGAAKTSTTTLHGILDNHPDIFVSEEKEPEFLARDDRYAEGLDEYLKLFEGAKPGQMVGEASVIYSMAPLFPKTAERMKAHFPDAKIIYIMRDPTDRAYSFYGHLIKAWQRHHHRYEVHRTFEEFVLEEAHANAAPRDMVLSAANDHWPDTTELCLVGSEYATQIEAYLEHFDRSQMLFLKFEDFIARQDWFLRQVTDFLGVSPITDHVALEELKALNMASQHHEMVAEVRAIGKLKETLAPVWGLRKVVPSSVRAALKPAVAERIEVEEDHVPPPMLPETRAMLDARFKKQKSRLEELTGLDFSDWKAFA
ncbi:MAG: sulfotransferase domain-containing protein [Pseudomonadota bacterium]